MAKDLSKIDFSLYDFDAEKGIFSKHWKRYCKGSPNKNGYMIVWLKTTDGRKMSFAYHRVMCYVFNERPKELENVPYEELDVNHKDENRSNNAASNLEWITTRDNINYGNGNSRRSATLKTVEHTSEWNQKVADALSKKVVQIKDNGEVVIWKSIAECHKNGYLQGAVSQCVNNKLHMEKNLKSHRRYKRSEWYGYDEYLKMVEEGALS